MSMQITISEVAQLAVGIAAIAALFIGPWMNFNNSRRLVIAENRQDWLNKVREDIAKIISIHGEIVVHHARNAALKNKTPDPPDLLRQVAELSARVRMRLNMGKESHVALNTAISEFVSDQSSADPNKVIRAMDPIVQEVWGDVKRGRI